MYAVKEAKSKKAKKRKTGKYHDRHVTKIVGRSININSELRTVFNKPIQLKASLSIWMFYII
jgi:hypothetical protein